MSMPWAFSVPSRHCVLQKVGIITCSTLLVADMNGILQITANGINYWCACSNKPEYMGALFHLPLGLLSNDIIALVLAC